MTLATLAAFAASLLVLFLTPGPGVLAMVGRTMEGGPLAGAAYGFGILTGDIVWLTIAITGLAAAADAASGHAAWFWIVKLIGAGVLLWFAWGALRGFLIPKPIDAPPPVSRRGLAATYAAGVTMPLSDPKAIAFYLAFLPAFFDLSEVGPSDYALMVTILIAMGVIFIGVYVAGARKARGWLAQRGVKRWADLVTAIIMAGVAVLLVVR